MEGQALERVVAKARREWRQAENHPQKTTGRRKGLVNASPEGEYYLRRRGALWAIFQHDA